MNNYQTFETDRLVLRPTLPEDASFLLELMNTPKWLKYIGDRNVHSLEEAIQYIQERMTPQLERLGYSSYTMIRKVDGTKLGTCGLYDREGLSGIDIGFALLPSFEQQGYAFEAAHQLKEAAQYIFNIATIQAITTQDNFGSQRLLEKLGLVFIELIKIPGDDKELMLYRIVF